VRALKFDKIELVKFLYDNGPRFILYDLCFNFKVPYSGENWPFGQDAYQDDYYFELSSAIGRHPKNFAFLLYTLDLDSIMKGNYQ
jgi:hypothetical protein